MTITASDRVFIDANILIYAHSILAPLHAVAVSMLQGMAGIGAGLWVSRQVFREYLAGMTRPGTFTGMAPVASLAADIRRFETQFRVAEDGPGVTAEHLTLLGTIPARGKQVHDANIVATMLAHGVPNLLTHNVADFARYAHLITVIPLVPPPAPGVP